MAGQLRWSDTSEVEPSSYPEQLHVRLDGKNAHVSPARFFCRRNPIRVKLSWIQQTRESALAAG
jgi:hypothetical protein